MKILLIAPNCYPVNGAEEICNIKMLRAMTEDGDFEVDVVSRKRSWFNYPSGSLESYGVKVNSLTIVESDNKVSLKTIWQSLRCLLVFGVVYKGSQWAYVALPYIKSLIKNHKYDFVLTKNSPSLLLGYYLHKRGIKWVASWNDPYPVNYYPHPYGDGKESKGTIVSRRLVKIMSFADAHIFPTDRLRDHMLYYLKAQRNRCWVAPHIVFREDKSRNNDQSKDKVLRIIHSGNLSAPRDPSTFMMALNAILLENPTYMIEFTILGRLDNASKELLKTLTPLNEHFSFHDPIEYKDSLAFLSGFDLACVIEANCGVGGGVFLPTKVTDFLQSNLPTLAVSPQCGVLEDLHKKGVIGYYADVNSISSIKSVLISIYDDFCKNNLHEGVIDESFLPQSVMSVYKDIYRSLNHN